MLRACFWWISWAPRFYPMVQGSAELEAEKMLPRPTAYFHRQGHPTAGHRAAWYTGTPVCNTSRKKERTLSSYIIFFLYPQMWFCSREIQPLPGLPSNDGSALRRHGQCRCAINSLFFNPPHLVLKMLILAHIIWCMSCAMAFDTSFVGTYILKSTRLKRMPSSSKPPLVLDTIQWIGRECGLS